MVSKFTGSGKTSARLNSIDKNQENQTESGFQHFSIDKVTSKQSSRNAKLVSVAKRVGSNLSNKNESIAMIR